MTERNTMKSKKVVKLAAPALEADPKTGLIAANVEQILKELGEDPSREGLLRTPQRSEKALRFLTSGYDSNIEEIVNGALFDVEYDEMVLVKDIEFFSLCEHHMLPFFGRMHVAYLPNKKVIGLSKIPRIVDMFARRLQVQERLTQQVAHALAGALDARGVGVIAEAQHFCMMMRGVEKQCSSTATSAMLGAFRSSKATRDEFLSLVRLK
ncbi:MAG: GTP cyclohydrolase I FolE [Bryobacteraceae bacterium]|nr:GTP cyclohydrolase I FolE [Bryobacteraceae bacterium]